MDSILRGIAAHGRGAPTRIAIVVALAVACGGVAFGHSPLMDADVSDWCFGAFSNTAPGGGRTEDSYVALNCGNCAVTTDLACESSADCPGEACVNLTGKSEVAWWDNRTDGAVNDLGTVAVTHDNTNLYFAAELWVDPDPSSLPFGEIAIDVIPGGKTTWHDPSAQLKRPGTCSVSTDRACASNADCHFCNLSTEPFPSTRVRACGSGCDPDIGDFCDMTQTCQNLGAGGATPSVGIASSPVLEPDYLLVFDFSRWLIGLTDSTMLMKNVGGTWTPQGTFAPAVNPGAAGGSGGPPGSMEVAIPWSSFGCVGCPGACVCPDIGPGVDFRFSMIIARGSLTLDYTPDGAIEDVMSEPVAGSTTTTTSSCPGFGITTTFCELTNASTDAFVPPAATVPGGRTSGLLIGKSGSNVTLTWDPSCSTADTDYEIYEGELGDYSTHALLQCSTGGSNTASFLPDTDSVYYLIVPTNGATEGSYGVDSNLAERSPGTTVCHAQSLGNCP